MEKNEISTKIDLLSKSKEFISKYFSQILFVPIFLGGLSQIYNLITISPDLVRFFSATHAVADGLFLLAIVIYMYILTTIFLTILFTVDEIILPKFIKDHKTLLDNEEQLKEERNSPIIYSFLYLVFFLSITFLPLFYFPSIFFYSSFILFFVCTPIIFLGILSASQSMAKIYGRLTNREFGYEFKDFYGIVIVMTLICSIRILNISVQSNYITNFKYVIEDFREKMPKSNPQISYYNDKYLFIKYFDNLDEKVYIQKIDTLFEKIK